MDDQHDLVQNILEGNVESVKQYFEGICTDHDEIFKVLRNQTHDTTGGNNTLLHIAITMEHASMCLIIMNYMKSLKAEQIDQILALPNLDKITVLQESCSISKGRKEFLHVVERILDLANHANKLKEHLAHKNALDMTPFMSCFYEGNVNCSRKILRYCMKSNIHEWLITPEDNAPIDIFEISLRPDFIHTDCIQMVSDILNPNTTDKEVGWFWQLLMKKGVRYECLGTASTEIIQWIVQQVVDKEEILIKTCLDEDSAADGEIRSADVDCCDARDFSKVLMSKSIAWEFLTSHYEVKSLRKKVTIVEILQMNNRAHLLSPIFTLHKVKLAPYHCSSKKLIDSKCHKYVLFDKEIEIQQIKSSTSICKTNSRFQDPHAVTNKSSLCMYETKLTNGDNPRRKKRTLLNIMNKAGCKELIGHEYTRGYLEAYCNYGRGKKFVSYRILFFLLLIVTLSVSVSWRRKYHNMPSRCPLAGLGDIRKNETSAYEIHLNASHDDFQNISRNISHPAKPEEVHKFSKSSRSVVFMFCTLASISLLILELLKMIGLRSKYWKIPPNYLGLIITVMSPIVSGMCILPDEPINQFLVFLEIPILLNTYTYGAWMVSRMSIVSPPEDAPLLTRYYWKAWSSLRMNILMMFKVALNVIAFFPVMVYVVLSFALAFRYLFDCEDGFSNIGNSALKMFVMAIGELDFDGTFLVKSSGWTNGTHVQVRCHPNFI